MNLEQYMIALYYILSCEYCAFCSVTPNSSYLKYQVATYKVTVEIPMKISTSIGYMLYIDDYITKQRDSTFSLLQ